MRVTIELGKGLRAKQNLVRVKLKSQMKKYNGNSGFKVTPYLELVVQ